jgi:Uma2 family endonuclease
MLRSGCLAGEFKIGFYNSAATLEVMTLLADPELERLSHSPLLPEIVASLLQRVQAEKTRRIRFYEEMTPEQKIEFIDGSVVLHSPARNAHLVATLNIATSLKMFLREAPTGGRVRVEKCLCVFPRNDYEPDIVYFGPDKARDFTPEMMRFPVPDFVVEVLSESTEANDRGVKFVDYAARGVVEYWIVDADKTVVEQYVAKDGQFELRTKSSNGQVVSVAIPGFAVEIGSIFADA